MPRKEPLLGEDHPIKCYLAYLGCIGGLIYAALKVDTSVHVEMFSTVTLCAFGGCGFFFAMFGYFLNPNFLCYAANMFTLFESKLLGRPYKVFTHADSYEMFQAGIDSVMGAKNAVAQNFMFAVTIKLRVECHFWLVSGIVCAYCLTLDLEERKTMHLLTALMGTCAMATDFNHVGLFPFNIWGYNHFTNNLGRFIGYAFGFTFLFVNFMSYVVVYNLFGLSSVDLGIVDFLNSLLSLLFPLWPWEPFFVMPFVLEFFKGRGHTSGVILFLTLFAAVFCLAHSSGLVQAVDTFVLGGKGICVPALPGAPTDVDTTLMCQMMAVHIFLMVTMGVLFAYLALDPAKRAPTKNSELVYYARASLFFIIGGISQDIPYWAVCYQNPSRFVEFMSNPGFYSVRGITPGFTEFFAPIVWILYGVYAMNTAMRLVPSML